MLQITQTDNGQLTGVLSVVEANKDSQIETVQRPFTGALDNGQITLSFKELLGTNTLSGKARANTIDLQFVDSTAGVHTWAFALGSAEEFGKYSTAIRAQVDSAKVNATLAQIVQICERTINQAEAWLATSQGRASRISNIYDRYKEIESGMRTLIDKERQTRNPVTRSQISVAITQGGVTGTQTDVQVDQVWDNVVDSGAALLRELSQSCGPTEAELRARNAAPDSIADFKVACENLAREKTRFEPEFRRVAEVRNSLKIFQAEAEKRRQALDNLGTRLQ